MYEFDVCLTETLFVQQQLFPLKKEPQQISLKINQLLSIIHVLNQFNAFRNFRKSMVTFFGVFDFFQTSPNLFPLVKIFRLVQLLMRNDLIALKL